MKLLIATQDRSCTPVKEGDESPDFRKVKIESLVELEWSIACILLAMDKLFYIQEVGDNPPIKAILHAMDWLSVKGVIYSLLGDLG